MWKNVLWVKSVFDIIGRIYFLFSIWSFDYMACLQLCYLYTSAWCCLTWGRQGFFISVTEVGMYRKEKIETGVGTWVTLKNLVISYMVYIIFHLVFSVFNICTLSNYVLVLYERNFNCVLITEVTLMFLLHNSENMKFFVHIL